MAYNCQIKLAFTHIKLKLFTATYKTPLNRSIFTLGSLFLAEPSNSRGNTSAAAGYTQGGVKMKSWPLSVRALVHSLGESIALYPVFT